MSLDIFIAEKNLKKFQLEVECWNQFTNTISTTRNSIYLDDLIIILTDGVTEARNSEGTFIDKQNF